MRFGQVFPKAFFYRLGEGGQKGSHGLDGVLVVLGKTHLKQSQWGRHE